MQWYLLKTWVGKEEELIKEIHRAVPPQRYHECFVIYQERVWRKQKRSIVHQEPLFPGCVFLTCKETKSGKEAESLLHYIEHFPSIAMRISGKSLSLFPMMNEDAQFLEQLSGDDHVVKLSYVLKNEEGTVGRISEPLNLFQGQIERIQFKKRYAMVRHRLWGEEQIFVLGIALKEDIEQKRIDSTENKRHDFDQDSLFDVDHYLKRKPCFERKNYIEAEDEFERKNCIKRENKVKIANYIEQKQRFVIRIPAEERA